jgi:hypothetical protein
MLLSNVHRVTDVKLCCGEVTPSYAAWHAEQPVSPVSAPVPRATVVPCEFNWIFSSPWKLDRPPVLSHFGL